MSKAFDIETWLKDIIIEEIDYSSIAAEIDVSDVAGEIDYCNLGEYVDNESVAAYLEVDTGTIERKVTEWLTYNSTSLTLEMTPILVNAMQEDAAQRRLLPRFRRSAGRLWTRAKGLLRRKKSI